MEYKFSFYDGIYGLHKSVTGLVMNVYEDQIKIKCIDSKKDMADCDESKNHILPPMPTCNCVLNPPDMSKYDEPDIYFIPIKNIMDVSYITNAITKPKGGTRIMILGISATIIKAIVVKLEFFDDNCEESIKCVDLETDKVYDLIYEYNGSVYENRVKIVGIEDCACITDNPNSIVRENIGFDNTVYLDICHNKDDFMRGDPVRQVKITVDTSETFDGNLEVIMLDSIRDCTLVEDIDDDTPDNV